MLHILAWHWGSIEGMSNTLACTGVQTPMVEAHHPLTAALMCQRPLVSRQIFCA